MSIDYYDGEEKDPRLQVELWRLSPYIPSVKQVNHYFGGIHFDERGLVLKYNDGDYQRPRTYEMQIVFSSGFENIRVQNNLGLFKDNKLGSLLEKSGAKDLTFWAFCCKYTNYFNWCVQQSLDHEYLEKHGCHYILAADCMLVDVFSLEQPRIFFDGWGMNTPEKDRYPCNDVLYRYHSP